MFKLILKSSFFLSIAQLINSLLNFIIMVIIARTFSIGDYGQISLIITFVSIFEILFDSGLISYFTRESSKDLTFFQNNFYKFLSIKFYLSIFIVPIIFITGRIFGYSNSTCSLFVVFGMGQALVSISTFTRSSFYIYKKTNKTALLTILYSIIRFLAIFILLQYNTTIKNFFILISVINFAFFIFTGIYTHNIFLPKLRFLNVTSPDTYIFLKKSFYFCIMSFIGMLYFRIDIIMLSKLGSLDLVGIYNAQYRFIHFFAIFSGILGSVLLPFFSRSIKDKFLIISTSAKINLNIFRLIIPVFLFFFFFSKEILQITFNETIASEYLSLSILSFSFFFLFFNVVFGTILIVINEQRLCVFNTVLCLLANVVINYIFIPSYGILAASTATVITEFTLFMLNLFFIRKHYTKKNIFQGSGYPLLLSLIYLLLLIPMVDNFLMKFIFISIVYYAITYKNEVNKLFKLQKNC